MEVDDCAAKKAFRLSRRKFLAAGGATVILSSIQGSAGPLSLRSKKYPVKKIASLSDLKQDEPITFQYPDDHYLSSNFLVKLGTPAGGGIGDQEDIVAFNHFCTHMGGPLMSTYKKEYKAMGPCPFHLTTFDLTRHGMVIAGHATESLPQIMLEIRDGDIYATGIMGLLYGHHDNLA